MQYDKTTEAKAAQKFKALSHPTRSWIVKELMQNEHCVGEFVNAVGVEFATMSRHLAKLRKVGLIEFRKCGREMRYRINRAAIEGLFAEIRGS